MRLNKGSKVEVLNEMEGPSGAWQCGVIVSGNGHIYIVRYDWCLNLEGQAVVERVPWKAIRPCPPPVHGANCWAVGDIVEVFDVGFWKMATVVEVLDENYYLARLLGSFEEFRIHKSRIRVRQVLENEEWIVIGKVPGSAYHNYTVSRLNLRIKLPTGNDCLPPPENNSCEDSNIVSSASLKRPSQCCSLHAEASPRKMIAIEKESGRQQVLCRSPSYLLKMVDDVAYPRENFAERYIQSSYTCSSTQYYEKEKGILNQSNSCFQKNSDSVIDNDACSIESVGSCSVIRNGSIKSCGLAGDSEDEGTLCSDADSYSGDTDVQANASFPPKGDAAARFCRSELQAYRHTLMLMHGSGSLSWEQEDLLTNLRISLNISNDEHLMEVRNLISAGTNCYVS